MPNVNDIESAWHNIDLLSSTQFVSRAFTDIFLTKFLIPRCDLNLLLRREPTEDKIYIFGARVMEKSIAGPTINTIRFRKYTIGTTSTFHEGEQQTESD